MPALMLRFSPISARLLLRATPTPMAAATEIFLPDSLLRPCSDAAVGLSVPGVLVEVSGVLASLVSVSTPDAPAFLPLAKSSWFFFCSSTVVPASGFSLPVASFLACLAPLAPAVVSVVREVSDFAINSTPVELSMLRFKLADTSSTAMAAASEAPTAVSPCACAVALVVIAFF